MKHLPTQHCARCEQHAREAERVRGKLAQQQHMAQAQRERDQATIRHLRQVIWDIADALDVHDVDDNHLAHIAKGQQHALKTATENAKRQHATIRHLSRLAVRRNGQAALRQAEDGWL